MKNSTGLSFENLAKSNGFDIGENEVSSVEALLKIRNLKKKLNANVGLTKTSKIHMQMEVSLQRNDVIHSFEEINFTDPFPELDQ